MEMYRRLPSPRAPSVRLHEYPGTVQYRGKDQSHPAVPRVEGH